MFSVVFFAWIFSWWKRHKAIKSDPSELCFLFPRIERLMWWMSDAMFGHSGISQNMTSSGCLCLDFNRSDWYFCILFVWFYKFENILFNIIRKRFHDFFCVYWIRTNQTMSQWLNEWSAVFFKRIDQIKFWKRHAINEFNSIFVFSKFCECELFKKIVTNNLFDYFSFVIKFRFHLQILWSKNFHCLTFFS